MSDEIVSVLEKMSEEELATFKLVAEPAIVSLGKHFGVQEHAAVEAYGHIMALTVSVEALTFDECLRYIKALLLKPVTQLNPTEGRLGLCLKLLRVKSKPFLSASKNIGRNDPCPCKSGAKFKNCCLSETKKHEYEEYKNAGKN